MSAERSARRVASNTAVQVAGKGVVLAIGFVSIAVLTRYLGPGDYGRYTLALTYMQLFGVLADVGLFTIVVRDISREPARTEELVGNTLTLRLVLALGVIALAAALSLLLPYEPDVRVAIAIAGLPLLFGMLGTTFLAVLQARLRMGRAVAADIAGRAVGLGLVGAGGGGRPRLLRRARRRRRRRPGHGGRHLAAHPTDRRRAAAPGARGVAAPAARRRCRSGSRSR